MKLSELISQLTAEYLLNGEAEVRRGYSAYTENVELGICRKPGVRHIGELVLERTEYQTAEEMQEIYDKLIASSKLDEKQRQYISWQPLRPKTKSKKP
jgi:hypothetical protein